MTSFVRYYNQDKVLVKISMTIMESMIRDETKKDIVADYVYDRLYGRFLKIFDYKDSLEGVFYNSEQDKITNKSISKKVFDTEYKNGFLQMAACSLLIETFAAFLTGEDETPNKKSVDRFKKVFVYADEKGNDLKKFKNNPFYGNIRCGLLHQGETKGNYTITRKKDTPIIDENGTRINAFKFHAALKKLLKLYVQDLKDDPWDSQLWDACRMKIQHIIDKTKS